MNRRQAGRPLWVPRLPLLRGNKPSPERPRAVREAEYLTATRAYAAGGASAEEPFNLHVVIAASSLGKVIEWYDFYMYGSPAVFFPGLLKCA